MTVVELQLAIKYSYYGEWKLLKFGSKLDS